MKIRNNLFLIAALTFTAFVLVTCSDGLDNQGSININFDNSGARYAGAENDATMLYTITLTSPGKAPITRTTNTSISIPVSEGTWNIKVDAEGRRVRGEGEADKPVIVTAGRSAFAKIGMRVTGTRVKDWLELEQDFNELGIKNGKLKDLDNIEVTANLTANSGLESTTTTQEIILWAKKDVTITRGSRLISAPVFTIEKCKLILDGTKGKITIDGDKDIVTSSRALINVMTGSTLTMLDGVTITNNVSSSSVSGGFGGGVYVENGIFYMKGGIISNNRASTKGGGVYIDNRNNNVAGIFEKTGGTIYGYTSGNTDSNEVSSNGSIVNDGGHAIYDKGKIYNDTFGINDNYPLL